MRRATSTASPEPHASSQPGGSACLPELVPAELHPSLAWMSNAPELRCELNSARLLWLLVQR